MIGITIVEISELWIATLNRKVLGGSVTRVDPRRGQDIFGDFCFIGGYRESIFK